MKVDSFLYINPPQNVDFKREFANFDNQKKTPNDFCKTKLFENKIISIQRRQQTSSTRSHTIPKTISCRINPREPTIPILILVTPRNKVENTKLHET